MSKQESTFNIMNGSVTLFYEDSNPNYIHFRTSDVDTIELSKLITSLLRSEHVSCRSSYRNTDNGEVITLKLQEYPKHGAPEVPLPKQRCNQIINRICARLDQLQNDTHSNHAPEGDSSMRIIMSGETILKVEKSAFKKLISEALYTSNITGKYSLPAGQDSPSLFAQLTDAIAQEMPSSPRYTDIAPAVEHGISRVHKQTGIKISLHDISYLQDCMEERFQTAHYAALEKSQLKKNQWVLPDGKTLGIVEYEDDVGFRITLGGIAPRSAQDNTYSINLGYLQSVVKAVCEAEEKKLNKEIGAEGDSDSEFKLRYAVYDTGKTRPNFHPMDTDTANRITDAVRAAFDKIHACVERGMSFDAAIQQTLNAIEHPGSPTPQVQPTEEVKQASVQLSEKASRLSSEALLNAVRKGVFNAGVPHEHFAECVGSIMGSIPNSETLDKAIKVGTAGISSAGNINQHVIEAINEAANGRRL